MTAHLRDAQQDFDAARPRMFSVAYRMTGSVSDAEDICQDAWVRWWNTDRDRIDQPEAYLVTVATRLALDKLKAGERRRESYVGPFLPEPVVALPGMAAPVDPPAEAAELSDSLTYAFLLLLDQLTPLERAVLLLHDVFAYPFTDVAEIVQRSEASVRQIASRTRRKVEQARPTSVQRPDSDDLQGTLTRLLVAISSGDIEAVMAEMAPDVVELNDGGALQRAARRPIVGADRVARVWVNLAKRFDDISIRFAEVNGNPGMVFWRGDAVFMVTSVEVDANGKVSRIYSQLNPAKLSHLEHWG